MYHPTIHNANIVNGPFRCWRGRASEKDQDIQFSAALGVRNPGTYDSARSTERVGGEVGSELGLDDTGVTVRPRDTSPHDSDLGAVDFSLGLVDVGNSLQRGWYVSLRSSSFRRAWLVCRESAGGHQRQI